MQLEPKNRNRPTPLATALSNRLTWMRRLSEKKSAGRLALAAIPPTTAAAANHTAIVPVPFGGDPAVSKPTVIPNPRVRIAEAAACPGSSSRCR